MEQMEDNESERLNKVAKEEVEEKEEEPNFSRSVIISATPLSVGSCFDEQTQMDDVDGASRPMEINDGSEPASSSPHPSQGRSSRRGGRFFGRKLISQDREPSSSGPPPINDHGVEDLQRLVDDNKHLANIWKTNPAVADQMVYRASLKSVIKFYSRLQPRTKKWVDMSGFARFLSISKIGNIDRTVCSALVERWWDTTHTFHLPNVEVALTPLDFVMLTGIPIGRGLPVVFDRSYETITAAQPYLPLLKAEDINGGSVSFVHLQKYSEIVPDDTDEAESQHQAIARAFLLYLLGQCVFPHARSEIRLGYLAGLIDIDSVGKYDWGSAMLGYLYCGLDKASRCGGKNFMGFHPLLQIFFYEYFIVMNPVLIDPSEDLWPRMQRWRDDARCRVRGAIRFNTGLARYQLESRTFESVNWRPWVSSVHMHEPDVQLALKLSQTRMVLASPDMHAWYLGDRAYRQIHGYLVIPRDPPPEMPMTRELCRIFTDKELVEYANGGWFPAASYTLEEVPYADWYQYWRRVSLGSIFPLASRAINIDLVGTARLQDQISHPTLPTYNPGTYGNPTHTSTKDDVPLLDRHARRCGVAGKPSIVPIPRVDLADLDGIAPVSDWTTEALHDEYMESLCLVAGMRELLISSTTEYGKMAEKFEIRALRAEEENLQLRQYIQDHVTVWIRIAEEVS